MESSSRWVPSDFNQEELLEAAQVLNENFMDVFSINPVLGKLILTLHAEILQEVFLQFAKGDPEKREQLKKIILEQDGH